MKWNEKTAAVLVGAGCLALVTTLLVRGLVGPSHYVGLFVMSIAAAITVASLPRLQELTMKLTEMKVVLAQAEKTKAEIAEMYGGIEHLKRTPLVLDNNKIAELGLHPGHIASSTAAMRHTVGCIKRERERLARIFVSEKTPDKIAEAIFDASLDDKVFKFDGPEVPLDTPVKSAEQRRIERGSPI